MRARATAIAVIVAALMTCATPALARESYQARAEKAVLAWAKHQHIPSGAVYVQVRCLTPRGQMVACAATYDAGIGTGPLCSRTVRVSGPRFAIRQTDTNC